MNRQNAIRHTLSTLYKYKASHNKDLFQECIDAFDKIPMPLMHGINYCTWCDNDDFGYCSLRNHDMPAEIVFDKWCCDSMIKNLEILLIKEQRRKHGD